MKYLLKRTQEEIHSDPGNKIREVYELDSVNMKLVKVGEIDISKQINSYKAETNYKALIEKLHSPEDIEAYFTKKVENYGDATMISDNYIDNYDTLKKVEEIQGQLNYNFDTGEITETEVKEKEKDEPNEI